MVLVVDKYFIPANYISLLFTSINLLAIYKLAPLTTAAQITEQAEAYYFARQRKKILLCVVCLKLIFVIFNQSKLLALLMYITFVILNSMILEIIKNEWRRKKR